LKFLKTGGALVKNHKKVVKIFLKILKEPRMRLVVKPWAQSCVAYDSSSRNRAFKGMKRIGVWS